MKWMINRMFNILCNLLQQQRFARHCVKNDYLHSLMARCCYFLLSYPSIAAGGLAKAYSLYISWFSFDILPFLSTTKTFEYESIEHIAQHSKVKTLPIKMTKTKNMLLIIFRLQFMIERNQFYKVFHSMLKPKWGKTTLWDRSTKHCAPIQFQLSELIIRYSIYCTIRAYCHKIYWFL